MTLQAKPPNATHWSLSSMGAAAGLSRRSIQRIWSKHGLKPHLIETFKVSRDFGGRPMVTTYTGKIADGVFKGKSFLARHIPREGAEVWLSTNEIAIAAGRNGDADYETSTSASHARRRAAHP